MKKHITLRLADDNGAALSIESIADQLRGMSRKTRLTIFDAADISLHGNDALCIQYSAPPTPALDDLDTAKLDAVYFGEGAK